MFAFNTLDKDVLREKVSALPAGSPRCIIPDENLTLSVSRDLMSS
jgi:hypothetical protein